jgi:hypothetical protein
MSPAKPIDVVIRSPMDLRSLDYGKPYPEYGEKKKTSTNDWSCYILAKEGEVGTISVSSCSNTYVLRPEFFGSMHKYDGETSRGSRLR